MELRVDHIKSVDDFTGILGPRNSNNKPMRQSNNWYATKKSIRHELLNLSLLAANSSNLRHILTRREENRYFWVGIFCIIFSIVLQVLLGQDIYINDILVF